jgi:hypothetical protein
MKTIKPIHFVKENIFIVYDGREIKVDKVLWINTNNGSLCIQACYYGSKKPLIIVLWNKNFDKKKYSNSYWLFKCNILNDYFNATYCKKSGTYCFILLISLILSILSILSILRKINYFNI